MQCLFSENFFAVIVDMFFNTTHATGFTFHFLYYIVIEIFYVNKILLFKRDAKWKIDLIGLSKLG